MQAGIEIHAEELGVSDHPEETGHSSAALFANGMESVHVSGPGEADANGDEWGGAKWECHLCNERLTEDGQTIDGTRGDCAESETGEHEPESIPHSWLNSAGINVDRDDDTVTVRISVGDPRGAFVMRVERLQYTDTDGNDVDELRLQVPSDQDGMPHMTLEPLTSPGYYRIKD